MPSFKSAQSDAMLCLLCNADIVLFEMIITKLAPEVKQQWAGTNIKLWKAQLDAAATLKHHSPPAGVQTVINLKEYFKHLNTGLSKKNSNLHGLTSL